MKLNINKVLLYNCLPLLAGGLASCENSDNDFPDYEGGVSVYFANQYPVRTIVLGEDEYDTSRDNAHQCQLQATMGGSYTGKNIKVQIAVDNDLCKNLYFADGVTPVLPMPSNYYTLSSTTMDYKGGFTGAVDVQLTDAFFNDPKALSNNYVIPVVMTSQTGADQILSGRTIIEGEQAQRTNAGRWDVAPKDYMLYCVKFISKYDANYLRRGVDQINFGGNTRNVVRHKGVENDEVKDDITTLGLNDVSYPVEVQVTDGQYRNCTLRLSFDGSGKCTVSSMTDGVTASGSGSYNEKSEKKAWNNKDRDGLYLDYKINFADATVSTRDTLVWQSRGVVKEEFAPVYLEK